eukprot:3495-Heterococcus_DN1.PRE.2
MYLQTGSCDSGASSSEPLAMKANTSKFVHRIRNHWLSRVAREMALSLDSTGSPSRPMLAAWPNPGHAALAQALTGARLRTILSWQRCDAILLPSSAAAFEKKPLARP